MKRYLFAALAILLASISLARADDCRYTAAISADAGATTEVVALTAGQRIRVCAVSLSLTATGTAKFVYGTGTNCGTGTTDITSAQTLATGVPLALGMTGDNFLLEALVSNALCVTAATGNARGWVRYQKF